MRGEVDLYKSEQKNATVETLAAQEASRLERNRREQTATELDDTRTRLTQAYEELRRVQDDAAAQRVEAERARLGADRVSEQLAAKDRELEAAREKELRLAQARSESLSAIEGLQGDLKRAQAAQHKAEELAQQKEAEAASAIRSLDLEAQRHADLSREAQNAVSRSKELAEELSEREGQLAGAETELQATKAASTRLQRDIETLAYSERTWREMAQAYEQRLNDTLANVEALSEQVARLDAEKEAEVARFNRLEKDLTTAIGAERSARDQAQASLADSQAKLAELNDDREQLLEQRDDLTAAVEDLQKARATVNVTVAERDARVAELEQNGAAAALEREALLNDKATLDARIGELEHAALDAADRLAERDARANRLTEQLAEAQDQTERAEGELGERLRAAEDRVRELERERDQAKADSARLSGQLDQGRQRVADLAQRSARLETEANALRARIAEVEAQSHDHQERLQETQVKFTHASRAAADAERIVREQLEQREAELTQARADADADRARLAQQIAEVEKAQREAATRAIDREREIETVRDSLAATEAGRARLEATLEADAREAGQRRTELETQLSEARETIARLETRGEVLANESRVTQHELDVQLQKIAELETRAKTAAEEADQTLFETKERAQRELIEAKDLAEQQLAAAEGAATQRSSVLAQEIEHYKTDRLELEGRLTSAQQHSEHLDAELAEAAEVRATEAQLREKAEAERDAARAELAAARVDALKANEWVIGGKSENEKLTAQLATMTVDLQRAADEHRTANKTIEALRLDLSSTRDQVQSMFRASEEKDRDRIDVVDQLSRDRAELSIARQQLEAAKAESGRGQDDTKKLRDELAELQTRFDAQLKSQRDELEARAVAQQRETNAAHEQLDSLKKELELNAINVEKAQSEARGHQAGKLQAQKELDALRGELTQVKASLAVAGGEAQAIAEARALAEAELQALQARAQDAEGRVARGEGRLSELESFLSLVQEQKKGLEAEVAAVKGLATGSAGELEAAMAGRRQAEELLIKLRTKYAELELQMQTDLPAMRDQIHEMQADNQMLDAERERLAAQIERLEATRTQGADQERELAHRVEMLQRRVTAQDAELQALRRRAGTIPPGTQPGVRVSVPAAAIAPPKATAPPPVVKGSLLADSPEPPTLTGKMPLQGRTPLGTPIHTAVTPVMSPVVKDPRALRPPAPPPVKAKPQEDVELEVFELEVDENGDDEELLLLDEEASDPPGTPPGGKK